MGLQSEGSASVKLEHLLQRSEHSLDLQTTNPLVRPSLIHLSAHTERQSQEVVEDGVGREPLLLCRSTLSISKGQIEVEGGSTFSAKLTSKVSLLFDLCADFQCRSQVITFPTKDALQRTLGQPFEPLPLISLKRVNGKSGYEPWPDWALR